MHSHGIEDAHEARDARNDHLLMEARTATGARTGTETIRMERDPSDVPRRREHVTSQG